jgi:hypothetical protein
LTGLGGSGGISHLAVNLIWNFENELPKQVEQGSGGQRFQTLLDESGYSSFVFEDVAGSGLK